MLTKAFTFNPVGENTYLIWDEDSREAAIIDAGMSNQRENAIISEFIANDKLKLKYALQTHMHFDHIWGLSFIEETYGLNWNLPAIERYLNEGETLQLGDTVIKVLHTPGHTPGGLSFYIESAHTLFTGDTLFKGSIGRTDLPGGNLTDELNSIKNKIITLPPETIIYSGHGPESNIKWELMNNPYLHM